MVPRTSLPWLKRPLVTATVAPQERGRESAGKRFSLTPLRRISLPVSVQSLSSSWFSLPPISSLTSAFSARSAAAPGRKQAGPAPTPLGGTNLGPQIKEESSEDFRQDVSDSTHSSGEQSHPVPGEGADAPAATETSGSEDKDAGERGGAAPGGQ